MGIDTMLFVHDLAAGTYTEGDIINFDLKSGPTVVRDGLGQPVLKSITTGVLSSRTTAGVSLQFYVQNSNWNDPIINTPATLGSATGLSEDSGGYQPGNDCPMQVNSSFSVYAVVMQTVTTTDDQSAYCSIDIEYPNVPGLQNPAGEVGTPCSIAYEFDSLAIPACGALESTPWTEKSFDKFKAGYRYLLQKVCVSISAATVFYGFIKISGGASMGGLARIIPVSSASSAVSKVITYTAPEVKGPFNIAVLPSMYANVAGTADVDIVCDYVKRM